MPPFSTLRFESRIPTLGCASSAVALPAPTVAPESVAGTATAAASPPLDLRKSRREVPLGADEPGSGVAAAPRLGMVGFRMGLSCRIGYWRRAANLLRGASHHDGAPSLRRR